MEAIQALKTACQTKTFQSFRTLQPGDYIVQRLTLVLTTHGQRIRIDFEETYMYLPERFAQIMTPEKIESLNSALAPKLMMIFGGKDRNNRDR